MNQSKLFTASIRQFLSDFGPSLVIVGMSILSALPVVKSSGVVIATLPLPIAAASSLSPHLLSLSAVLHNLWSIPIQLRLLSFFPAVLLSMLFFLDQNISSRAVNSICVRKGGAYHVDMAVLSAITFCLSLLGLPWVCAATVQVIV